MTRQQLLYFIIAILSGFIVGYGIIGPLVTHMAK